MGPPTPETRTPSRSREPDSVLGPPGQERTRMSTERGIQLPTVSYVTPHGELSNSPRRLYSSPRRGRAANRARWGSKGLGRRPGMGKGSSGSHRATPGNAPGLQRSLWRSADAEACEDRRGKQNLIVSLDCLRTGSTRPRLTRKPDGHWGGQQRHPQPRSATHTVNSSHSARRRRRGPGGRARQANSLAE